jgi:hypothetical protein
MVSEEVRAVFEMPMAERVWTQLDKLGLSGKELEAHFLGYYAGVRRTDTYAQPRLIFLEWGEQELQPKLNRKLHRDYCHPTFNSMMEYLLKKEILYRRSQYSDVNKNTK